jgi:hypothetical protein
LYFLTKFLIVLFFPGVLILLSANQSKNVKAPFSQWKRVGGRESIFFQKDIKKTALTFQILSDPHKTTIKVFIVLIVDKNLKY